MGVVDEYTMEEEALSMEGHPLIELLVAHYQDSVRWKESRGDLSPAAFNREYGIVIQGPVRWPYLEAIKAVCNEAVNEGAANIVVIYGSTPQYDLISKGLGSDPSRDAFLAYMSWQEIYSAMQLVNNDARLLQGIRETLTKADLVVFMGAPLAVTEVIDQVRALCDGCLITFA